MSTKIEDTRKENGTRVAGAGTAVQHGARRATMKEAALKLAAAGMHVFRVRPGGKEPLPGGRGHLDATTDPAVVEAWWTECPDAGIGVSCAASGLVVLDVDPRNGGTATLAKLEHELGPLPDTVTARTGGGGLHLLFGAEGQEFVGKAGPGVDVKHHGYVVVAPSRHPSGRCYAWEVAPGEMPPAKLPPAWRARLVKTGNVPRFVQPGAPRRRNQTTAYGAKALRTETQKMVEAPVGDRNNVLNAAAFACGQLHAGGEVTEEQARTALLAAARDAGLSDREALSTIASGWSAGCAAPRSAPETPGRSERTADAGRSSVLPSGASVAISGVVRDRYGRMTADITLSDATGKVLLVDRARVNDDAGLAEWARAVTRTPVAGVPAPDDLVAAIRALVPKLLEQPSEDGRNNQAGELVALVHALADDGNDALELFHDPSSRAYVSLAVEAHVETWAVQGRPFKLWLVRQYHAVHGAPPQPQAMQTALAVLEAEALFTGPEHAVALRTGRSGRHIYLDLGDTGYTTIEVSSADWRILKRSPLRFRRTRGSLALPVPAPGGTIEELRPFLNLASEDDWRLLVTAMVAALLPHGPFPVLVVFGEQGSAKSTATRVIGRLLDPNVVPLRAEPRCLQDLIIAANNCRVLAFDNLSHLQPWLSDALCRLSTGGGFSTRQLFTDDDEVLFDVQRPVVLNGIEELATRADLLDRAILLALPAIPAARRRMEADFWASFEAARPALLGALLDCLVGVLRVIDSVQVENPPRMADFARLGVAVEKVLGWPAGAFLAAYEANRAAARALALDADLVASYLVQFMEARASWEGTASELLVQLNLRFKDDPMRHQRERSWPRSGQALSNAVRRLVPSLRGVGVEVAFDRQKDRRAIRLTRTANAPAEPRPPLAATASPAAASPPPTRGSLRAEGTLMRKVFGDGRFALAKPAFARSAQPAPGAPGPTRPCRARIPRPR